MDAFFDGLDCRLRVSCMVADSIMMGIVNSAMEDAYKKSCSKEGDIERLNEKSRFCELAIMQLEWCLKYLQEETDNNNNNIIESTHDREKLLSDLLETRDRIHNRLQETELAITDKDRELTERNESLSQLRLALEVKDDDITSLHSALRLEKVKTGVRKNGDLAFHELKNTVDQQIRKTRGKLEDGRKNLTDVMNKVNVSSELESGFKVDDQEISCVRILQAEQVQSETVLDTGCFDKHNRASESDLLNCHLVEQLKQEYDEMATDVDILKGKIDSSFEMMETVVSLLKSTLDEQQWIWNVEEETIIVIIRSFLRDIQHEGNLSPLMFDMNWPAFMDDIRSLHDELEMLDSQKDGQPKTDCGVELRTTHRYISSSLIVGDKDKNASLRDNNILEDYDSGGISTRGDEGFSDASSKVGKSAGNGKGLSSQNHSGHFVAEMIRNHESIIWRKTQEINWLKGELLSEKNFSNLSNDRNLDSVKEVIARVVARLDSFIKKKVESAAACDNHRRAYETGRNFLQNDLTGFRLMEKDQTSIVIPGQPGKNLCCYLTGNKLREEIRLLQQETNDLETKAMILEDTYAILINGLIRRLHLESIDYDVETLIREDTYRVVFSEIVKEWNNESVPYNIERLLMEDIYFIAFIELGKDINDAVNSTSLRRQEEDLPFGNNLEDTERVLCSEMVKEWNNEKESYVIERLLMEDIFCIVFIEVIKDTENTVNLSSMRGQEENKQFRINQCQNSAISERTNQMQEIDSLSNHFDVAGDLDFNFESELMKPHCHLDLIGCELEGSNEQHIQHGQLLVEKDDASNLVTGKFEKALQQIVTSKMQLRESMSSLELPLKERDLEHDLVTSTNGIVQDGTLSLCLPTKYEERHSTEIQFVPMDLTKFSQAIMDFEHMAHDKIKANISRLNDMNHQLNCHVVQVNSIKRNKLLYRKAFTRRCYDLQTAEAEVDLLGDQVDQLLGLIEKIYIELDHYSPVLQHYFGVTDILKLMRKELHGEATFTSKQ